MVLHQTQVEILKPFQKKHVYNLKFLTQVLVYCVIQLKYAFMGIKRLQQFYTISYFADFNGEKNV